MRFCVNEASTMPTGFATDVRAYATAGFEGIELWLAKVETFLESASLADAQALLADHGLTATAACAQGQLLVSQGTVRQEALDALRRKLELCQALDSPVLIVASESPNKVTIDDYDRAAKSLVQVAETAAGYGVTIALEFIKGSSLVGSVSTAADLIARVDHPNLSLLFDTFHYYAGVSKPADIGVIPKGKVAFVHVNDCLDLPRELLTDAHRTYLGQGPIPVRRLVDALAERSYDGWLSFEAFNRDMWEEDPYKVANSIKRNMEEVLG
jgi:4-hydroxyphenylpyruvate dioxygenase